MKTIAVIEGGYSHEKIVSIKSADTVFKNIDSQFYIPFRVIIDEKGWFVLVDNKKIVIDRTDFSFMLNNQKKTFDLAFIMIHGTPGEDGKLQAYFDMIGIPYSTCGHLASTITFNKYVCNQFLKTFDIKVANALLIRVDDKINTPDIVKKIGFPCFIKPVDGGSSFGVTKVKEEKELKAAIKKALEHGTAALIESFIQGREVTNGIYLSKNGIKVLPITEIVTENEFFDFDAKYLGQSKEITPADLPKELEENIKSITKKIYQLLNLKGICRIDYIIAQQQPYLIEINTIPGQSAQSLIPQMAAYEGISLKELFSDVIEVALAKTN